MSVSDQPARRRPRVSLSRAAAAVRRARDLARRILVGRQGATSLEWTLLLAGIAIPSYFILMLALNILVQHYRLVTTLNSLPFP